MGTYTMTRTVKTHTSNTTMRREILEFPTCQIPSNAIKITGISLYFCFRTSWGGVNVTNKWVMAGSTNSASLTNWAYKDDYDCYYQHPDHQYSFFDATYYTNHMPASVQLVNQNKAFSTGGSTSSGTGNTWKTITLTPTTLGENPANWRGKKIYLGAYFISATTSSGSSSSLSDCLWGTNVSGYSITLTYTENTAPTGVSAINYPAANSTYTYNTKPWFKATLGTDPDAGDQLQLGWAIYDNTNSTWPVSTVWDSTYRNGGAVVEWQCTTALTRGHTYTLCCYQRDKAGVETSDQSAKPQRSFIVGTPFGAVSSGSLIDDGVADSAQSQINNLRAYYGMSTTSFTTINAGTTLDDAHIDQMETALEATPHVGDITTVNSPNKCIPADMNNLRNALLNG